MMRNMTPILNFLLFTIIFLDYSVNCWSAPVKLQDESTASYAVFDHLFADYNKHVRPVRNSTTVTHVFMDIGLRGILGTDAVQQVIVLKEWLRMFWKDEFLRWNPEDYGGIREIQVPRSMIWLPDVTLIDLVSKMQTLADDRSFVIVDHEGFVRHSVDQVVTVFCDYRITMFPFDQQNCSVHFEPWHSTVNEVLLQVGPLPDTTHYRPSNEWELVSYSARTGHIKYQSILPYETSRVFYDIVIRRRPHYYVASFMLPCFIIMELSLLGLFSPSNDSGEHSEKVTMGLTSLLSMTVLLLMISESLPKTNQGLPLLGLFVLVEIFIGALATATTVCVSHLQSGWRRSKRIPPFLKYLERWHPLRTRVHRKKSSEGDLFAATWKETHSVRDLTGIRENTRKTGIMAQIGNFEYNMRMISASLERKAAHSRLRLQWASACERLDHLLLVLFLSVNAVFFVSILIIGYIEMHVFLMLFLFPFSSALSQPKIGDNEKQTQATEDEHYRIESGHISLNDSEVIILINSTFEVIEDFERQNETGIIEEESTTENPTTKTRRRYQKMRPSKMACRQYSTKEKYLMLEDAGARNQLYMADSPDEASKGFTSLFPEELETTFAADVQAEIDPQFCDSRCERIKSLLDQATRDRTVSRGQQTENKTEIAREREKTRESQTARQSAVLLSDSGPAEVDEGLRTQNSCYLENFIPVGKCSEPGEEGTWTHDQLCSECRGVYMLNRECFPSFFNAVRCNKKELGCIFDTFSHKAHGECHTQSLAFKVLRNRGDTNCEDWIIEQIELPVSCQCMLSKSSWLRSQPPKEL